MSGMEKLQEIWTVSPPPRILPQAGLSPCLASAGRLGALPWIPKRALPPLQQDRLKVQWAFSICNFSPLTFMCIDSKAVWFTDAGAVKSLVWSKDSLRLKAAMQFHHPVHYKKMFRSGFIVMFQRAHTSRQAEISTIYATGLRKNR